MTNKIEISRELADRLTRAYPAEITDQETIQAIRIEALAALDELRALLAAPYHVVCSNGILCQDRSCAECGGNGATEIAAPAVERQEPVAKVVSKFGDPEAFGEREVVVLADLSKIPYDTNLYTSPPAPAVERQEPAAWIDGAPSGPWASEWFIAITTHGERVVLRQLPEDYTYDFTTADATYIMRDRIKKWMQFPDSDFVPFSPPAPVAVATHDEDAQNVKRYEWIRSPNVGHCEISRVLFETISDDCNPPYRSLKCGKDLDTAIDACLDKVKEMNK